MALAACASVVVVLVEVPARPPPIPPLYSEGVAISEGGGVVAVPPQTVARYLAGTSLLDPVAVPGVAKPTVREVQVARGWLTAGPVPTPDGSYRDMYERALLDLRALTLPNGASVAAWGPPRFRYVWPRDASFAVAAFSATGHHDDAERILRFFARVQPDDGRWQARYLPDGSGRVPDDRGVQLDGAGWVAWATWLWYVNARDRPSARTALHKLWPMIERSADWVAASLDRRGLPPASSDYWERRERKVTLGTAAPLLAGLRASAALAREVGRTPEATRWARGAARLNTGIQRTFRPHGYPRTTPVGGADAAVTFLAAPFAQPDPAVTRALETAADRLHVSNGGHKPGERWHRDDVAWTPTTAMFALAFAASGNHGEAHRWLDWLSSHRTTLGALPERVNPKGAPVSVAPLGWTAAGVLLAIRALEGGLPLPPVS